MNDIRLDVDGAEALIFMGILSDAAASAEAKARKGREKGYGSFEQSCLDLVERIATKYHRDFVEALFPAAEAEELEAKEEADHFAHLGVGDPDCRLCERDFDASMSAWSA